jgi:rhomboid protease GluP
MVERLYGNRLFGLIYFFGLLASSLASIWWDHQRVIIGASGAVFAVYGALLAFMLIRRGAFSKQALRGIGGSAAAFVLYNILFGLTVPGISNAAHLGGLVSGFALGLLVTTPLDRQLRARSLRRATYTGIAASLLSLSAMFVLIPKSWINIKSDEAVCAAAARVGADRDRIVLDFQTLIERMNKSEITVAECSSQIEGRLLPAWDSAHAELLKLDIPRSAVAEREWLDMLLDYYQKRRELMQLMVEKLLTIKPDKNGIISFDSINPAIQEAMNREDSSLSRLNACVLKRATRLLGGK